MTPVLFPQPTKTRNPDLRLRIVRILRIARKRLSAQAVALRTPMRSRANRANPSHKARGPPWAHATTTADQPHLFPYGAHRE